MERADAERPDWQPLDVLGAERLLRLRRLRAPDNAPREQHEHAARAEPPQRERERARKQVPRPTGGGPPVAPRGPRRNHPKTSGAAGGDRSGPDLRLPDARLA